MAGNVSENWKRWKQVCDSLEIASRFNEQENKYLISKPDLPQIYRTALCRTSMAHYVWTPETYRENRDH